MKLLGALAVWFCLSLIKVHGKDSSQRCNKLASIVMELRDNLFRNRVLSKLLEADQIESYLKDIIGVDIDDNEAVSNFSCLVVACESPSELASLLHVQKSDVEHALWVAEHVEEHYSEPTESFKQEARKLHRWLVNSGFPDQWPVKTSLKENKNLLKKNEMMGTFVTFGYNGKSFMAAKALTEVLSLPEYLEKIERSGMDEEMLEYYLMSNRELATDNGLKALIKGVDTVVKFWITLGDLKLAQ